MVDLGSIGKGLGGMVTSQEGKDQVMKFISTPEGMAMLQQFVGSPQGKELAGKLLMPILGNLGVPDSIKQSLEQFVPK
jgi:hypothetical protein